MTQESFEFHALLTELDEGLDLLHRSVESLCDAAGRPVDDPAIMRFEIALAEIGGNVLTHGRPAGREWPVEYDLRYDGRKVEASFVDAGPPAHEHLERDMPGVDHEAGRGLALSRSVLDELGYERDGEFNRWRLVKRL